MSIYNRLSEIALMKELLGRYTGLYMMLYKDKVVSKEKYLEELYYIREKLITVSGIDDEDILLLNQIIKELDG